MINLEPALLDAVIIMVIVGGMYSCSKMVFGFCDFIGEAKMNIFGGQPGSGSQRITCNRSDADVEELKQKDIYAGMVKEDGGFDISKFESPNTQVRHPLDSGDGLSLTSVEHPIMGITAKAGSIINPEALEEITGLDTKLRGFFYTIDDESEIRERMQSLIELLSLPLNEDEKWNHINGFYCQLSCGKARNKAEVIKKYFQMLTPNFKRKDGTVYSKAISPEAAQGVIQELIDVYPWDVPIKVEPIKHSASEQRSNEIDALKESVSDLMNVIAEINDRLDKIK